MFHLIVKGSEAIARGRILARLNVYPYFKQETKEGESIFHVRAEPSVERRLVEWSCEPRSTLLMHSKLAGGRVFLAPSAGWGDLLALETYLASLELDPGYTLASGGCYSVGIAHAPHSPTIVRGAIGWEMQTSLGRLGFVPSFA